MASSPSREEKHIVLACTNNNKFGQVLNLPELPVHSCVQRTPTSKGTHTHTCPHMPPQPTLGKAFIQTKRLLLAKAKAMLQRPQQSLFIAEAFNTTTIQKRNTAWHREELQQLNEPDCRARFRAFPSTAALDLLPCRRPAQSPIAGKPASGNTRTSEDSQSL